MAISIVSMVEGQKKSMPECLNGNLELENEENVTAIPLSDYGPRYDWNEYIQAVLLGGYFWSYAIFSLPAGSVSEWWGPFKVILWTSIFSSIINAISVPAAKWNWWALFVCRFIVGALGAFMYPALQALIASWAHPNEKGKFVSALFGNSLSIVVTWSLVGYVTSKLKWDWGFYVLSIQLALYCILFFATVTDYPQQHRLMSEKELAYITEGQGTSVANEPRSPPYKKMLLNGPFWILTILNFGNMWGLYIQLQLVPKFMSEVIGFNIEDSGAYGALPHLVRVFCGLGFGALGDFLTKKKYFSKNIVRKSFVIPSHIIPGILLMSTCLVGCAWVPILVLLILSMSFTGAMVMTALLNPQDLSPNFAGTIYGIVSCTGAFPGFLIPAIHAYFISKNNGVREWCYTASIGGVINILCGVIFILFGSVKEQSWNILDDE